MPDSGQSFNDYLASLAPVKGMTGAVLATSEYLRVRDQVRYDWYADPHVHSGYYVRAATERLRMPAGEQTLRPIQAAALMAAYKHGGGPIIQGESAVLSSPRGAFVSARTGCHAPGQLVIMHDGTRKVVENVRVGDLLMGLDSTPREVLELHQGHQNMWQVLPTKGEPWVVNAGHVLSMIESGERYGLIDLSLEQYFELSAKRQRNMKLLRTGYELPDRELPLDPYFLGVLLGDGCLTQQLGVAKPDAKIERLCHEQAALFGGHIRTTTDPTRCPTHYFVGVPRLRAALTGMGLYPIVCENRFVPEDYLLGSRTQRLQLLAGLLDTDGSLSHGGYDWISKSPTLALHMVELAQSVGLAAYSQTCEKSCQNGFTGTYYRVSIYGECDAIPCRIPRKQAPPRQQIKNALRTGFTLRPVGFGKYYGFSISGDQRYLLGDTTITHNSGKTLISLLAAETLDSQSPVLIVPASLRDETQKQAYELRHHWKVRPIRILSYETISHPKHRQTLANCRPDLIVMDECDECTNPRAACSNRIAETIEAFKPRILAMTGTPMNRSMREYRHILKWVHGSNLPFPREWDEFCQWHLAMDEKVPEGTRIEPGALLQLSPATEDELELEPLEQARSRYGTRLRSWPGCVFSGSDIPDIKLVCTVNTLEPTPAILDAAEYMREPRPSGLCELPCGAPVDSPLDMWRHDREFSCGLYGRWKVQPPPEWSRARKAWSACVRDITQRQSKWDSPMLVAHAIDQGHIPSPAPEILAEWRRLEPTFETETEWVWLDDSMLVYCAEWLAREQGICWVQHRTFAAELERRTGVPWFGRQGSGRDARGVPIDMHEGPAIASINSCSRGFNLHGAKGKKAKHHKNLLATCPTKNRQLEQLISRTHRDSAQEHKTVHAEFVLRLEGDAKALAQATADAYYVWRNTKQPQRLTVAEWVRNDLT